MGVLSRGAGIVVAVVLAVVLAGPSGPVAAASRGRDLERALAGSAAAEGAAEIERAFRAATKSGVRERDALELVRDCAGAGFDAGQIARVLSLAAQLALEELPLEGFYDKVGEGIAKRMSPDRVVQAAERRALTLNRARGLVNAAVLAGAEIDDREETVADVAGALETGRDEDEVRGILREGGSSRDLRRRLFR